MKTAIVIFPIGGLVLRKIELSDDEIAGLTDEQINHLAIGRALESDVTPDEYDIDMDLGDAFVDEILDEESE